MEGFQPVAVSYRFRVDSRTGRWTGALAWPRTPDDPPVWPATLVAMTLFTQWTVQRAVTHGVAAHGLGCGLLVLVDVDQARAGSPPPWVARLPARTVALLPEDEAFTLTGPNPSRVPRPRGPRLHVTRDRDGTLWATVAHPNAPDGAGTVWSAHLTETGLATPNQRHVTVDDPTQTVAHGFHPDLIDLTGQYVPVPGSAEEFLDLTDPDRARRP